MIATPTTMPGRPVLPSNLAPLTYAPNPTTQLGNPPQPRARGYEPVMQQNAMAQQQAQQRAIAQAQQQAIAQQHAEEIAQHVMNRPVPQPGGPLTGNFQPQFYFPQPAVAPQPVPQPAFNPVYGSQAGGYLPQAQATFNASNLGAQLNPGQPAPLGMVAPQGIQALALPMAAPMAYTR